MEIASLMYEHWIITTIWIVVLMPWNKINVTWDRRKKDEQQ